MDRLRHRIPLLHALLLLCVSSAVLGQVPGGSILGDIYDEGGASVSAAKLVLENRGTGARRTAVASSLGNYEFAALAPGSYDLSIEATGFRHTVERSIVVNVGAAVRVDVTLSVGSVRETIDVKADPAAIQPDKVSIGSVVELASVRSLPLQDRQFLNLALMVPGTLPGAPGTKVAGTSLEAFSVAGMRSQSNNYSLDGMSNNDPHVNGPLNLFRIADAVQEFYVETSFFGVDRVLNSGS